MLPRLLAALIVLTLLLPPQPAVACLWDDDTLRDEQRGLPVMSAILAGKWERHSPYFYDQRAQRMRALLAEKPDDLAAMDNLAVALEKLGRVDEAIAVMQGKLGLPDTGEHPHYTTHANLGTFYFHRFGTSGDTADLDRGIEHIEQALQINENAHFGRERFQLQAAQYIRAAQDDPTVLDKGSFILPMILGPERLREFEERYAAAEDDEERKQALVSALDAVRDPQAATDKRKAELQPAIDGIVGMIRFGTGKSAHLYYALGDLLAARGDKHLACRAYLRALEFNHPRPEMVREALEAAADIIRGVDLDYITTDFEREKAEANSWVAEYQKFEDDLVRRGVDLSDESVYEPFYARHGQPRAELGFALQDHVPAWLPLQSLGILLVLAGGLLFVVAPTFLWWRRRRRPATA